MFSCELFLYTSKWRQAEYRARISASPIADPMTGHDLLEGNVMIKTEGITTTSQLRLRGKQPTSTPFQHQLALAAIMLASLFMNFYQLGQHGFGNLFYAAGVRSMADKPA